jgi:protein O-mannosyl-transferase
MPSSATAAARQPKVISRVPAQSLGSQEKRSTVLCLLLVLLTLAFYNPIVHNGFTNLDDENYIVHNPHVRAGLTWDTVKWAFTTFDAANWHPLTWLSHALDCQLFNLNPVGHHYVTVLLQAVNAILLFLLLQSATGLAWPSLVVAALFALHPVNVESVAWAAERKNVLSMLFFLLTLHAYGWYVRRASVKRYAVVAGLFALGLMAKPQIITLPFVLLLWDYWPLRRMFGDSVLSSQFSVLKGRSTEEGAVAAGGVVPRSFSYLFLEKVPLLLLSAGSAVVTLLAQRAGHAVRVASDQVRFGNAVVAYVRYLGKAFWPARLAAVYPHPEGSLPAWEIAGSAAVLLLVTGLVLRWRERRYLAVGWFWFLGTMVPMIGIVQVGVQAMADRYAYLPYIGLFVGVVWGLTEIARERKISAVWWAAPAVLVLLTLGMLSRRQLAYWHDSETLWRHTLSVTEHNFMAHDGLARTLARQGRAQEALAEFNAAEKVAVYSASALIDIGIYAQTNGRLQDAIGQYQQSVEASTDAKSRAVALSYLGLAFTQMGDASRARTSYANALQQNPDNTTALVGSGLLAEREGDFALAATQISHAMKVEPSDVGYLLLGQALRRAGRSAEADNALVLAQRISRNFAQAQQSAAQVLYSAGIQEN